MNRNRQVLAAALGFGALALFAVACGGGDDNAGDDSSAGDSGPGKDSTVDTDSGPPADTGAPDTGPFCNTTPCVVSLGVGGIHSCVILSDATVRCWGGNQQGALGSGTDGGGGTFLPTTSATPLTVTGLSNAAKVSGGGFYGSDIGYTCALLKTHAVDCWGADLFGMLARGDASIPADTNPESVLLTNAIDVASGVYASCAVLSSGDVTCWGGNYGGQVSPPATSANDPQTTVINAGGTKFVHVSIGAANACALTDDAHVWCWGIDPVGENGHYTDGGEQDELPAQAVGVDSVVDVAAGYEATCVVKIDGSISCWGANIGGELGRGLSDGGPPLDYSQAPVSTPAGKKFTQIVSHLEGFCALADDGTVWCWGATVLGVAGSGLLDSGSIFPSQFNAATQVQGLSDIIQISSQAYSGHTCALVRGGAVKCWGYNNASELGTAPADGGVPFSITPLDVTF